MKFSCTQENLQRGLAVLGRIAGKNSNLPILQNILIKAEGGAITLSATNLEIGVKAIIRGKVDTEGSFTLPAQLLSNYVSLVTAERIDCELSGKEFRITADGQATVMKGEVASDFPILPVVDTTHQHRVLKTDIELALQQTVIAAAVDETRPEIAGVWLAFRQNTLTAAATDSYRLAERKVPLQASALETQVIVPQRSAQELLRIIQSTVAEEIVFYTSDSQFGCLIGDVEFMSRVIEGNFPDYAQIIPQTGNTTAQLEVAAFSKAVKGAALFSKTGVNDIELGFMPTDNVIQIKAVNVQLGQNVTRLPGQVTGEPVTIVFNHRFLLDGLQHLQGQTVSIMLLNSISPAIFRSVTDPNYTYIIMPIKQ